MDQRITLIGVFAWCWLLSTGSARASDARMAGSFLWHPATNPVGWVVFLPGSGGLRILGDDHHYLDVAGCLNRSGYSVLLVDYKPAYAAAGNAPKGDAGDKVAWVTGRAVEWMFREHPGTTALPGALVAWSLGAEGALRIVNDPVMSKELRLGAVVMYYPSNRRKSRMDNRLPVLVLAGEQDDVVRAKDVESLVRDRPEGAPPVELHMYRAAHHGFDVASLKKRKVVRILPLVGPRATLQYDPSAAADAEKRLLEFLSRNAVVSRPRRPG